MAEVYRLFDRHYRTATVLAKLVRLCQRAHRFTHVRQVLKGLLSANLEKALTFLDEACSATSNAVERGNHRYRKNAEGRLSRPHGGPRLSLDLFHEAVAQSRASTLSFLHTRRAGARTCQ